MSRGEILKLSDLKDMHGSITLEYTGILYTGVDREKKLRELAKVNPQEYCLALGVNDDSEIFKDISSGSLVSPMKFFKKLNNQKLKTKTMESKDFLIESENPNNCHRHSSPNGQTVLPANSTDGSRQCEESSSTDKDFRETEETFEQQLHCNGLCGIHSLLEGYPRIVEISDEELKRITLDSLPEGHLDNPGKKGRNGAELIADIDSKFGTNYSDYTWKQVRKRILQPTSNQTTH